MVGYFCFFISARDSPLASDGSGVSLASLTSCYHNISTWITRFIAVFSVERSWEPSLSYHTSFLARRARRVAFLGRGCYPGPWGLEFGTYRGHRTCFACWVVRGWRSFSSAMIRRKVYKNEPPGWILIFFIDCLNSEIPLLFEFKSCRHGVLRIAQ
jgi:hypothetical protein